MRHCIIVPLYKSFSLLTPVELVSLKQLFKILGDHKIIYIGPPSLDYSFYLNPDFEHTHKLTFQTFNETNFRGISGYNKLLISEHFLHTFKNYPFILMYQLDCFVFRDELNYWCDKGYDYVGAQWTGMHIYKGIPLVGVGNGGFSLRKVKSMLALLRQLRYLETLQKYQSFNCKGILPRLPKLLAQLMFSKKLVSDFANNYSFQEDVFWCVDAPMKLQNFEGNSLIINFLAKILVRSQFKIAPVETALQFSIETNPRELYNLNNGQLPFGCHAWEKYDPEFWKAFIPVS